MGENLLWDTSIGKFSKWFTVNFNKLNFTCSKCKINYFFNFFLFFFFTFYFKQYF